MLIKFTFACILACCFFQVEAENKVKLDAVVWKTANGSTWVNSDYDRYTYDSEGRKTEQISFSWKNSNWEKLHRYTYSYIVELKLASLNFQYFDDKFQMWIDSSKTTYTYNISKHLTQILVETKSGSSLQASYMETYLPDADGNSLETVSFSWEPELNNWQENVKVITEYDTNQQPTSILTYVWDEFLELWIDYEKEQFSYNADNTIIDYIYQTWDDFDKSWNDVFKDCTEFYNENGIPKLRYLSSVYNEQKKDWEYYSREFHTLRNDDRLLNYEEYYYNTMRGQWDYFDWEEYTYDTNGNLTSFVDKDKSSTVNRWVFASKEEMDYTSSVLQNDLVIPFEGANLDIYFNSQLNSIVMLTWDMQRSRWENSQKAEFSYSTFTSNNVGNIVNHLIKVFPNPSSNVVTVQLANMADSGKLQLFSINGQLVYSCLVQGKTTINTSDMPKGFYLLKITDSEGIKTTHKLITK